MPSYGGVASSPAVPHDARREQAANALHNGHVRRIANPSSIWCPSIKHVLRADAPRGPYIGPHAAGLQTVRRCTHSTRAAGNCSQPDPLEDDPIARVEGPHSCTSGKRAREKRQSHLLHLGLTGQLAAILYSRLLRHTARSTAHPSSCPARGCDMQSKMASTLPARAPVAHFTLYPLPAGTRGCPVVARVASVEQTASAQVSGLKHLSEDAKERAMKSKVKFEKVKVEKCGSTMWTEVPELARLIREGETKWEDLNLDDVDIRMKWAGLFHRGKRTPGKFMMRLRMPNGELNAAQLRFLGQAIRPYGEEGCADITTRANIQLRGVTLENADRVIDGLFSVGLTSFMSGMDNVRNLTGNPIAGLDPHELIDTRPILYKMQDMIVGEGGRGNAELTNLPRKINICISSTRDDFPHTQINDVGFEAVRHPETGEVVFNLMVGGYFSIKRNIMSVPAPFSVTQDQLIPFTEALLKVFRDHGPRADRQQSRLIWLVEAVGMDKWQALIEEAMGGVKLAPAVHVKYDDHWERRDLLGVHNQKQPGLCWVGACVPAGRLLADDFDEMARIAETYGDGTVRLTCEENVLFVNVPEEKIPAMLAEPLFQRFDVKPGLLTRAMVSCTGSQFCGFALAETKNRAVAMMASLEQQLELPRTIRVHFTGCPNSCGQAQVGDIGLMGAPAKKNGKATEGFKILLGGQIGENPALATDFAPGVPVDDLEEKLKEILISHFGAKPKAA